MKRAREVMKSTLWFLPVLASRVYIGTLLGLVAWAILPLFLHWQPTVVVSGSMEPGIKVGDIIVAQPLTQEQVTSTDFVTKGSVLLAHDPSHMDRVVTHRVVEILPSGSFVTKGDANAQKDSTPIPAKNVIGLERLRIPYIGIPIQAIRIGNVIPALIFTLITVIAQLFILKDRKLNKQKEKEPTAQKEMPVVEELESKSVTKNANNNRSGYKAAALTIITAGLIVASFTASESHAAFAGVSDNSTSNFAASTTFLNVSRSVTLAGTAASAFSANSTSAVANPTVFTLEAWFKTSSTKGGEIIGFSDTASGAATQHDRALYLGNDGTINFGVNGKGVDVIQSQLSYNDNVWHHVVLTNNANKGWALYIDGVNLGSDNKYHKTVAMTGYWRICGSGSLSGWSNEPSNIYFSGSLDDVAIYNSTLLTPAQVAAHYAARNSATTYQQQVLADTPSYYYQLNETSGPTAYDSSLNGQNATYGTSGVTFSSAGR